jgi:hypothetical protein
VAKIRHKPPTTRQNKLPQHFRAMPTSCQETLSFRERSRASQPRANPEFDGMSPVVASSSSSPCCPLRSNLTRRPAAGLFRLGFGAWRIACDSQVRGRGGAPLPHHSQRRVKRPGSVSAMTSQNCWSKALNAPNSAPARGKVGVADAEKSLSGRPCKTDAPHAFLQTNRK